MRTLENKLFELEQRQWTKGEFAKQNWGVWMHSISSYVGRIKPSFAHFLIDIFSEPEDLILDPFCGVGTVPLEADLMGRKSIGNDLNPYAYLISLSKFDRKGLTNELEYIKTLSKLSPSYDLTNVPDWVRVFYDDKTLQEILYFRDYLIKDKRYFFFK